MKHFKSSIESCDILKYSEYIKESNKKNFVYRFDDKKIDKFKLHTYYHSKDWKRSGLFNSKSKNLKGYSKSKGLFASGTMEDVVIYCVPRRIKRLITYTDKKPTIYFNESDKEKIENHTAYLSSFDKKEFERLPNGEYFSSKSLEPTEQKLIENPISLLKKYYKVKFEENLDDLKTEFEKSKIQFDSEGL